jgi:saccharopine dehydrogenase-like NADP-dependent oxidoreductase
MNKVLILGAGFVSRPIIEYLLSKPGVHVSVAARKLHKAEELLKGIKNPNGKAVLLNVDDEQSLKKLVGEHDVIVSLLPYTLHVKFAKLCIELKKHLVTTSYVSQEMKDLDAEAKKAGVLLLNEIGLDPGIDHMSAMRIFNDVRNNGGKIIGFESYCGGLPAPEDSDNPFGYKFSWSPKGVLKAGKNNAQYMRDGKIIKIDGKELFDNHWPMHVDGVNSALEGYPNRDSLGYIELYDLKDVKTMLRGTLRYANWSKKLRKISALGMLDEELNKKYEGLTYAQFMGELIGKKNASNIKNEVASYLGIPVDSHEIQAYEWLGLFSDEAIPEGVPASPIDILTDLMERKMAYKTGERDMVALHHKFTAEFPGQTKEITSTMVDFGIPNGDSSMARTVSLPCAIGVYMILQGKIKLTGVHIPVLPEIYNPVLDELETMNIKFVEKEAILR